MEGRCYAHWNGRWISCKTALLFLFQPCFPLVHYDCFIRLNQLQLLLYIRQHVCLKVDGDSFVHVLYHRDWRWIDNDTLCWKAQGNNAKTTSSCQSTGLKLLCSYTTWISLSLATCTVYSVCQPTSFSNHMDLDFTRVFLFVSAVSQWRIWLVDIITYGSSYKLQQDVQGVPFIGNRYPKRMARILHSLQISNDM